MLSARAIYRLLIDDEQPVPPPDDPSQTAFKFNPTDELTDPEAEIARYTEEPLRLRGTGPTSTYQDLQRKLEGVRNGPYGRRKKLQNNTYLHDRGNRIAVRLHATDVVTAFPDGKIVFDTGGWQTMTTRDRFGYGFDSGWSIFSHKGQWCWYNRATHKGDHEDDLRYPFTRGDAIFPDGTLQIQADPIVLRRRRRRKV